MRIFSEPFLEANNYRSYDSVYDQEFFNSVIYNSHYIRKVLRVSLLPREIFPAGTYYYDNHQSIRNKSVLIHFNCIGTKSLKINKMRDHEMWYAEHALKC